MHPVDPHILTQISQWPAAAQTHLLGVRSILLDAANAADLGPLDEALKWGQPAWRPRHARTGTTLRTGWSADRPAYLMVYVDCKTDLASQMSTRFPGQYQNDARRSLAFDPATPLPTEALSQLAYLTFTYHRRKRARQNMPQRQ
ncbi:MAG: hypothetical protein AAF727_09300 [Pseudomonadota bacterium]